MILRFGISDRRIKKTGVKAAAGAAALLIGMAGCSACTPVNVFAEAYDAAEGTFDDPDAGSEIEKEEDELWISELDMQPSSEDQAQIDPLTDMQPQADEAQKDPSLLNQPQADQSLVNQPQADGASAERADGEASAGSTEGSMDGKTAAGSTEGSTDGKAAAGSTEDSTDGKTKGLLAHVRGIRDFNLIEGMIPDPMAGISWDDEIGTVLCDTTEIDWSKPGKQELTYTIAAMDQTIIYQTINVTIYENLEYYLYGMEGEKTVTTGGSFDPMEGITYDKKLVSVTADTSELNLEKPGEYAVSYTLTDESGRTQSAVRRVKVASAGSAGWDNSDNAGNYSTVVDLGVWRLTAYMDTPEDQGPYVGQTASGAPLIAGRTVAVSAATCARRGLYFGDKLLIDGHVYTLEDHGGSAMNDQDWADIFVDNPIDEFSERFNRYSEVYLLR